MAWRGLATLEFSRGREIPWPTPSRLLVVSMEDALGLTEQ